MENIKEIHIELLQEEVDSLKNFNEICVFEDEGKGIKLFIKIPDTLENRRRLNILDRYDNVEYWEEDDYFKD